MEVAATLVDEVQGQFGPENPFYAASTLPFGAPPFDRIRDEHYGPALLQGMAEQAAEVRAIADNPAAATFENTIVALERTGALLDRVEAAFGAMVGAYTNPALEAIQQEMAPKFAAHADSINLNAALWQRVEALYDGRAGLGLDAESARLLEVYYRMFVHAGARLGDADKARLMALNVEESTLSTAFAMKLLAANKAAAFATVDKDALAGFSEAQLASAADAAKARGTEGYVVPLQNTTQQPVLAQLTVRATRQAIFDLSLTRTEKGDENDTRATIARLAQVRAEKGRLLGFETYAAWKLENQMAKTPEAAIRFMDALVEPAIALAAREQQEIQTAAGREFAIEPWDWEFYAEQVRRAKYDIDEAEVRPYFEFDRVLRDGVFHAATRLYGITFNERYDLPVYAPDVRVFDVFNADGSHLAMFYSDYWKRDNKRGGAWMSSFVRQSRLLGTEPAIYNVGNFTRPADGQPGLISFSDVTTMFHEFGHTLHGMFSDVMYPSLAGTSVPRDFVEFPSQFNEHWAMHPEIFSNFAKHYETGEPMPSELVAKLKAAEKFNQGYALTEVLAAAELDMEWHTLAPDAPAQEPGEFEEAALSRKGIAVRAVPPRYRSSYFAHIFGGGYAAGYYAYLWAEMLDAAGYEWFERNGGLTLENGDRLRRMVLSRGNAEEPREMYERWFGGEPEIGAMLKGRGLDDSGK
jgi:peptidyl-dipeptidase Dcp